MKTIWNIIVSIFIGTILAVIMTFIASPFLQDLEPTLSTDLASMTGPVDWVLFIAIIFFSFLIFIGRNLRDKK